VAVGTLLARSTSGDAGADAGIVDQGVDARLLIQNLLGQDADLVEGGQVGAVAGVRLVWTGLPDVGQGGSDAIVIAAVDEDPGAPGRQVNGKPAAQPVGGAGDEDGLPVDGCYLCKLLWCLAAAGPCSRRWPSSGAYRIS
jgi:hypothetical protein